MRFILTISLLFIAVFVTVWQWQRNLSSNLLLSSAIQFPKAEREHVYKSVSEITHIELISLHQGVEVASLMSLDAPQASRLLQHHAVVTLLGDQTVIFGHSSLPWWSQEKPLFEDLEKLSIGSKVYLQMKNSRLGYTVAARTILSPSDPLPLTAAFPKSVLLFTCYPKNSTSHRLIVTLHQQSGSLRFTIPRGYLVAPEASAQ